MAGGDKPEISITAKPEGGDKGDRRSLLAFWRDERSGYLTGKLDSRVRGFRVYMEDGTHFDVKRYKNDEGRDRCTHFFDAFENRDAGQRAPSRGGDEPPLPEDDGFGGFGDDIPFRQVDERLS